MITVLAQQGPVQLHVDTANSARTIRVSCTDPLEAMGITLQPEDLPGIALKLLRSVPTIPYSVNLDGAACCLVQYLEEQEAKQTEAKLQARRDDVSKRYCSIPYALLAVGTQKTVDRIIELEDKLEAQK